MQRAQPRGRPSTRDVVGQRTGRYKVHKAAAFRGLVSLDRSAPLIAVGVDAEDNVEESSLDGHCRLVAVAEPAHDVIAANGRNNVRVLAPHRLALRVFPLGNETFLDESCEFSGVSRICRVMLGVTFVKLAPIARESFTKAMAAQSADPCLTVDKFRNSERPTSHLLDEQFYCARGC